MNEPQEPEELEWLLDQLRLLGETAYSARNHAVIRLVNFYWEQVQARLHSFTPTWREAN